MWEEWSLLSFYHRFREVEQLAQRHTAGSPGVIKGPTQLFGFLRLGFQMVACFFNQLFPLVTQQLKGESQKALGSRLFTGCFMWDLQLVPPSLWASVFSSVNEGVGPDGMKPPLIRSSVYVWLTMPGWPCHVNNPSFAKRAEPGFAHGKGKNGSFTWAVCVGLAGIIARGNWLKEIALWYQRKPGYWWAAPVSPALLAKGAWAAGLPDTCQRRCQARDRPLWESADQSQTLVILRALAGTGHFLCPTMTTRSPPALPPALPFLSYCDREGQYFPQEKLCSTYRFSVLSGPYLDRCLYTLDTSLLSQGPPHTHSVLPSISQNQGAWDRKHGSSFSPSSGAGSGFPRSSCHLCWANFTWSFKL